MQSPAPPPANQSVLPTPQYPHAAPSDMDSSTLAASSLSSRSQATTEPSSLANSSIVPRLSFRARLRSKDKSASAPRPPVSPTTTDASAPPAADPHHHSLPAQAQSPPLRPTSPKQPNLRPWLRIRSKLSAMEPSSKPSPQSPTNITPSVSHARPPTHPDPPQALGSDFSATITSGNTSPASSAVKHAVNERQHSASNARRMLSNSNGSAPQKKRPIRRLLPPSRSIFHEKHSASISEFLRPLMPAAGSSSDSLDPSFKAHTHLLRKMTLDDFDVNRYLMGYSPLARVNAVLATCLLGVLEVDHKSCPMSPALRSAIMYIVGNSHQNVYVMTLAAQLKSTARSRPAAEGIMGPMVLEGQGLTDLEVSALDYAQELSSTNAVVSEATRQKVVNGHPECDGRLERLVTAASAYGAFLSCLTSTIDIELTHSSIQYASHNLQGLPWKSSGSPVNVDFFNDEMGDFGSGNGPSGLGSKYRPRRERLSLTRNYDRHNRDRSGGRAKTRGLRRVSQFFTSTLLGAKSVTDVNRVSENWMKAAEIPPGDQLFEINDEISSLFGFHPFYFSTMAMDGELNRRAFLFGVKELLFSEKEISHRLKFIICYVLSFGMERKRILDSEQSRSFEKQGVHNGHSITSVYSQRTYDSLSIMSAHAAYLACKYGAKPAELVAASDASRVRSAMERYAPQSGGKAAVHSIGFPLTRRDCAAVLIAHSLLKETPIIENGDLAWFETSFERPGRYAKESANMSRRALLEIFGAASMWMALERFATGTLGFDIDCTSNMVFGLGRAEPAIIAFCHSAEGRKIGLSLSSDENRDVMRGRSDSRASRTSSLRPSANSSKRVYRKRTSSALSSSSRVGRLFGSSSTMEESHSQPSTALAAG